MAAIDSGAEKTSNQLSNNKDEIKGFETLAICESKVVGPEETKKRKFEDVEEKNKVKMSTVPTLEDLHYDLVFLIIQYLDLDAATCIGLSCPKFYAHLKTFHPDPIPTVKYVPIDGQKPDKPIGFRSRTIDIGSAIIFWKGLEQYRYISFPEHKFLDTKIHGRYDTSSKARFRDYYRSYKAYPLPDPEESGWRWWRSSFEVIEKSLDTFENVADWRNLWSKYQVFTEHRAHWMRFSREYEEKKSATEGEHALVEDKCQCWVCTGGPMFVKLS